MFRIQASLWRDGRWQGAALEGDQCVRRITPLLECPTTRLIPGCIDCHIHGGGGADVMAGETALRTMLAVHAGLGISSLVATTVTAPNAEIDSVLAAAARVMAEPDSQASRLLGVHLEGPYLSPERLGAQPPLSRSVDAEQVAAWFATGVVRIMTYAPEADPHRVLPALAAAHGVRLQLGHTNCSYADAAFRISQGQGVTHLYNAMNGVSHRGGGLALASLCHSSFAEIICDGVHVEPPAFHLARKAIEKLYMVSDATSATGMPDGPYTLGSLTVHKVGDTVRLSDGTLAGSAVTMVRMLEVARQWGLGWPEISQRFSTYPAEWLGLEAILGRIAVDAYADFLELEGDLPVATWVGGVRIPLDSGTRAVETNHP